MQYSETELYENGFSKISLPLYPQECLDIVSNIEYCNKINLSEKSTIYELNLKNINNSKLSFLNNLNFELFKVFFPAVITSLAVVEKS